MPREEVHHLQARGRPARLCGHVPSLLHTLDEAGGGKALMQTFLPYADYEQTARVLDYRRLGKQRVETFQLLNALDGLTKGWATHPAALMWRGYEASLALYGVVICKEWKRRGYKDQMHERLSERYFQYREAGEHGYLQDPPWLGNASSTDRCSPMCRMTCRTSGRPD